MITVVLHHIYRIASRMASTPTQDSELIHIDGTTLEGGGQLFRLALSLSSLSGSPIQIINIRGNRAALSSKGQDGGVKPAHLAGASWLANVTQAKTDGLELKSRDLLFRPFEQEESNTTGGANREDVPTKKAQRAKDQVPIWKDVRGSDGVYRRQSVISLTTPGSVFLILQAILPYLLFTPHPAQPDADPDREQGDAICSRIVVKGGTNVWNSLSFEYAQQVLLPILNGKLGLGPIAMKLDKRGWSMGSKCIGQVTFDVTPLSAGCALNAFDLSDRGEVTKIHVSIIAPSAEMIERIRECVIFKLEKNFDDAEIEFPVTDLSGHRARLYLLLVAETSNGYRLGRDWLFDRRVDQVKPQATIEALVGKVVQDLVYELSHGGCVDEFLQDQLTVFQALAKGASQIVAGKPSLHTETTRWVSNKLLGVTFDGDGHCEGVGLRSGQEGLRGSQDTGELTATMEALTM